MIESPGSPWQSMPLDKLGSHVHEGKNEKRHKATVEVLHRLQTGKDVEGELWKILYEEYKANAGRWYRKYLEEQAVNRDDYQDRLYEKISENGYAVFNSYNTERGTFDGWFNEVLKNFTLDIMEKEIGNNEKKDTKKASELGERRENQEKGEIGKEEKLRMIKSSIDKAKEEGKIGEKEEEAFKLVEIEEYTQKEAAKKVGCSRRTIYNRKEKFINEVKKLADL